MRRGTASRPFLLAIDGTFCNAGHGAGAKPASHRGPEAGIGMKRSGIRCFVRSHRHVAAVATLLATSALTAQAAVPAGTGANWTQAGGTPQGTQFSNLSEITTANAGTLTEEFRIPTNTTGSHQGSPVVIGSTMYIVTPFPDDLIAVDLASQTVKWTFHPNPGAYSRGLTCCDVVNRGPAYGVKTDGTPVIVYTLLDGNVVAINATTGAQVWRTNVANPWAGETLNTAPIVVNGKVIFGSSGSEMGIRGSVRALDINTGALAWQAYSTGPDKDVLINKNFKPFYPKDQGANLGKTTWTGTMWQRGGASSWAWITYDPDTNQIFYGTSQPGTFNADQRPGDNKWSLTIFARNPDTGYANWAYQTNPHDNWDYDSVNESTVLDLRVNGQLRKTIVQFNKNGFMYMLDRVTGQLISAPQYAYQTWSTNGIDLTTGMPSINPAMLTHQGVVTQGICPSAFGAKDWEYSAYSPKTGLFYYGGHNLCMNYEGVQANYIQGTMFTGVSISMMPGPGGNMGEFVAFDPVKGQRAFTIAEPLPIFGGTLATAGNVVFYGTLTGSFKALDAQNGNLLWSTQLECGIVSPPISFKGPDGKQRVAITTGVGWLNGGFVGGTCPTEHQNNGSSGGDGGGGGRAAAAALPQGAAAADLGAKTAASLKPAATTVTSGYVHVFKLP